MDRKTLALLANKTEKILTNEAFWTNLDRTSCIPANYNFSQNTLEVYVLLNSLSAELGCDDMIGIIDSHEGIVIEDTRITLQALLKTARFMLED